MSNLTNDSSTPSSSDDDIPNVKWRDVPEMVEFVGDDADLAKALDASSNWIADYMRIVQGILNQNELWVNEEVAKTLWPDQPKTDQ